LRLGRAWTSGPAQHQYIHVQKAAPTTGGWITPCSQIQKRRDNPIIAPFLKGSPTKAGSYVLSGRFNFLHRKSDSALTINFKDLDLDDIAL